MKKIFHHLNRTLVRSLEIAGVLALVLFVAWLGLIWRLSQGPLNVDRYLTQRLEKAFHRDMPEFNFRLGTTQLIWGGRFEPFETEVQDVRISRADGTQVLAIRKLRVQLSKRNLVFGRIVPRVVRVFGPALRVIRHEDGRFTLNVGSGEEDEGAAEETAAAENGVEEMRLRLVKDVLRQLQEQEGLGILDGLREVEVSDARLLYDDRVLGVRWRSRDSSVTVRRGDRGIEASALVSLDMDATTRSAVRADINYDWETNTTSALVSFAGFNPSRAAQQSEQLKELSGIDLSLNGSIGFTLDGDFRPVSARVAVGSKEPGAFNAFGLYKEPVSVKSFFASGAFDVASGRGAVHELKIDLGGPSVKAAAQAVTQGGRRVVSVSGELLDMPMDKVGTYWPEALTPEPRWWVTTHLSGGTAARATIEAEGVYDPAAEKKFEVQKLGGEIDFSGIKVDYFPPLEPVLDAAGKATYDATNFNLAIKSGKLRDMKVTKSAIRIYDLDRIGAGEHSKIDIAVSLSGPLRTALQVLDAKPLEYPEMLGIRTKEVEGAADVDVSFKFPIHRGIRIGDVKVKADAKLKDVLLRDIAAGMDLMGGPMDLSVDNGALKVKGKGKLAGMPVTFDWLKNFSKDAKIQSRLNAGLPLDAVALFRFGVPEYMELEGVMPAEVEYVAHGGGVAELDLAGDIGRLGFSIPDAAYRKPAGTAGTLAMSVQLKDGEPQRITGLEFKSGGAVVKGDVEFAKGGKGLAAISKASLGTFTLGETDVAVEAVNRGKAGFDVTVSGRQLDASPVFRESGKPGSDADAAKMTAPLRLRLSVARLLTAEGKSLEKVKAYAERNAWRRIDRLELDAKAGGSDVSLRYLPSGGGRSLIFDAEDAGLALSALGLSKAIKGGKLHIEGHPRAQGGPRDMAGSAILTNFKINNAPVIAKLLNALSLVGILQMMSDDGLAFKKARVDFSWTDKGQPAQAENVRLLKLSEGKTFGSSLGLTFEGGIDNWKNVYDMKGTIVPVSGLSKILGAVPIVGTIVTAGGEGIIAATYTVKGPKDQPDVSVNPLAALAPGILRKMFFEN